jgi:transcriptional regulator with XRE-family HTH domain
MPDPRVTEAHRLFGLLLLDRRQRLGWSRTVLAKQANLSDATIKLIEHCLTIPSRGTLYSLLSVRELDLTEDDSAPLMPGRVVEPPTPGMRARANDSPRLLHVELCSSAEPLTHYQRHRALLGGSGVSLRSCWAYLDPASADDYRRFAMLSPERAEARAALEYLVPRIVRALDGSPLDVVALGCGLSLAEVDLTLWLAQQERLTRLSLGLVDLSTPLLAAGYRHAVEALQGFRWVDVWACAADLEQLALERDLITRCGRQRLFTLLGGTLAELENEDRLLRDTLGALAEPGDLLVLEVGLSGARWPVSRALSERLFTWLRGPFERAGHALVSLKLSEPHAGRWATLEREVLAEVPTETRPRRWCCYQLRRYELAALKARLEASGWSVVAERGYGRPQSGVLLLCQRPHPLEVARQVRASEPPQLALSANRAERSPVPDLAQAMT